MIWLFDQSFFMLNYLSGMNILQIICYDKLLSNFMITIDPTNKPEFFIQII